MRRVFPPIVLTLLACLATSPSAAQTPDIDRLIDEFEHGDSSIVVAIQPYVATEDRRRRCNAAFVLAGLGDERGVEILLSELQDTEPGSRLVGSQPRTGPSAGNLDALRRQQVGSDRYFAALLLG